MLLILIIKFVKSVIAHAKSNTKLMIIMGSILVIAIFCISMFYSHNLYKQSLNKGMNYDR